MPKEELHYVCQDHLKTLDGAKSALLFFWFVFFFSSEISSEKKTSSTNRMLFFFFFNRVPDQHGIIKQYFVETSLLLLTAGKRKKNFEGPEKILLTCSAHLNFKDQGPWESDAKSCLSEGGKNIKCRMLKAVWQDKQSSLKLSWRNCTVHFIF